MQHITDAMTLIQDSGVSEETVDRDTRRGSDTPGHGTKWKVYYRLAAGPRLGVLLAHETEADTLDRQIARLDEEAGNYATLRAAGFVVPHCATRAVATLDYLAGGVSAAALVVEHIAGHGPYKAGTQFRSIARIVGGSAAGLEPLYRQAWSALQMSARERCPMDLQVLLAHDGRIVTIDPERIGPGRILPPLAI